MTPTFAPRHRRQKSARCYPQQPVARAQIPARQASLRPAPSRRVLLLQTQAVPPRRHPLSKRPPEITEPSSLSLPSSYGCDKCPHCLASLYVSPRSARDGLTNRCVFDGLINGECFSAYAEHQLMLVLKRADTPSGTICATNILCASHISALDAAVCRAAPLYLVVC